MRMLNFGTVRTLGEARSSDLTLRNIHHCVAALATVETGLHRAAEFDDAIGERKEGMILAHAHILAGNNACTALAYDHHAGFRLAAVCDFYTQILGV